MRYDRSVPYRTKWCDHRGVNVLTGSVNVLTGSVNVLTGSVNVLTGVKILTPGVKILTQSVKILTTNELDMNGQSHMVAHGGTWWHMVGHGRTWFQTFPRGDIVRRSAEYLRRERNGTDGHTWSANGTDGAPRQHMARHERKIKEIN